MELDCSKTIYFYCFPPGPPENTGYQHSIICLAEGFKKLGVPFYSNINYWRLSPDNNDYLFYHNPSINPDDCDIVVVTYEWFELSGRVLPERLFHPQRQYITVYIDTADGSKTHSWKPEFRQFDFILRTHYGSKFRYPVNLYAWAFGLTERMLHELNEIPSYHDKKRHLLVNYRVNKLDHSVRARTRTELFSQLSNLLPIHEDLLSGFNKPSTDPYHYLQWCQTGRRHNPAYYKIMKDSVACAAFAGFFVSPWFSDASSQMSRLLKRIYSQRGWKSTRIVQWDSWRFWESLASGCVTFHLDLEKYGALAPVMPENWRHYIGIDLNNIPETVNRLTDEPELLEKISAAGRQWVLENYSPIPVAQRFLQTIS